MVSNNWIDSNNIISLIKYLDKFRKRIVLLLLLPFIFTILAYVYANQLLKILSVPLMGQLLFFLTPVEAIMTKIKLSFIVGIIIAYPFLVLLIISMLPDNVPKRTKYKLYIIVAPVSYLFLLSGMVFGYFFVLPTTLKFLITSAEGFIKPMISGNNYISFISFFLLTIGIIFELPLILIILSRINIIKAKHLMGKRKIVILVSVIVMAVLTPTPDAFTLLAVSIPIILLYEISLWGIFLLEKIDNRKNKNKEPM